MANLNLKSVKKTYDKTEVIHGVDLDINSVNSLFLLGHLVVVSLHSLE